jgi:hypothetical protein
VWQTAEGKYDADSVQRCILLDIREALQAIRARLDCGEFIGIPARLRQIERNTRRKRKKPALKIVKRSA